jgi:hypothetical protein
MKIGQFFISKMGRSPIKINQFSGKYGGLLKFFLKYEKG